MNQLGPSSGQHLATAKGSSDEQEGGEANTSSC